MTLAPLDTDRLAAQTERLSSGAPAWLAERRRAALAAASTLLWPSSQRDEDWRRTDISKVDWPSFSVVNATSLKDAVAGLVERINALGPAATVVVGPDTVTISGSDALAAAGVVVMSFADAALRHGELMQRALGLVPLDSVFLAEWSATADTGCFVHVPTGVAAPMPVWVIDAAGGDHAQRLPALLAVVEQGASLTLNQVLLSDTSEMTVNAVTATWVGDGARLDHGLLQALGGASTLVSNHRARLGRDAQLRFFGSSLGSRVQKAYWDCRLEGDGSTATLGGIAYGADHQHLDHQTLQAHVGAHTTSRLDLRVAVDDHARSVYSGLIDVAADAQHSDGHVQNRNLLLGPSARASSVPRLEIRANDVRCGHGTTATHIDDDQRIYLCSRGIDRAEADRLILRGFLEEGLAMAPDPGYRAVIGGELDRLLGEELDAGDA